MRSGMPAPRRRARVHSAQRTTLGPVGIRPRVRVLGHGAGFYVARALAWSAAILAVFVPLAVARYRRG